jgi:acyl-CoA synthetase (AMP-forming)/AMP-acid ligase II
MNPYKSLPQFLIHESAYTGRVAAMSSTLSPETIPNLVARNLENIPSDPFYIYAKLGSNEIVTITHLEFGRATHRAAHVLRPNREGQDGKVVAILAESDTMLYHAILVGLMTANFIVCALTLPCRHFILFWTISHFPFLLGIHHPRSSSSCVTRLATT